jgi:hypothetical protein
MNEIDTALVHLVGGQDDKNVNWLAPICMFETSSASVYHPMSADDNAHCAQA